MIDKTKKAMSYIVSLFLGGSLITFFGFYKGYDIAIVLSRPVGATGWTTSKEFIMSWTYVPVIIGVSLIIASITFSTALFVNWINKND
ncbi:MAG TPA: hypothetical protein VEF53_09205 [Patescibacteria group bacterium]|jgi:hypothetical protein|nr:hypothetical protein [Patescibacteria group bacterium]